MSVVGLGIYSTLKGSILRASILPVSISAYMSVGIPIALQSQEAHFLLMAKSIPIPRLFSLGWIVQNSIHEENLFDSKSVLGRTAALQHTRFTTN